MKSRYTRLQEYVDELAARIDALEEPAPVFEWKPRKPVDHSGTPIDAQAMMRDVAAELAYPDNSWDDWQYL